MLKAALECIPCILQGLLNLIKHSTRDEAQQRKLFREIVKLFGEEDWNRGPFELYRIAQSFISKTTGVADPYHELKEDSNKRALELYPEMKRIVLESDDPLKTAAKLATLGNVIDYGVTMETALENLVKKVKTVEFAIDDFERLKEKVLKSGSLIYFLDNAGEVVFDKLFLETMLDVRGKPFEELTIVCRKEPILNDAMFEDVEEAGLHKLPNVSIEAIDGDLRFIWGNEKVGVLERIKQHDVVIFKGQANFENFLDYSNAFFLLVVKCSVVSRILGVKVGDLVLKYSP